MSTHPMRATVWQVGDDRFEPPVTIEREPQEDGQVLYAVRRGQRVLCRPGLTWGREARPSERHDDHAVFHRFKSWEDAGWAAQRAYDDLLRAASRSPKGEAATDA